MNDDQLINKKFHILQRNKILKDNDRFIYNEIANRLNNSLDGINLSIKNCLEIGYTSNKISKYILSRFHKIDYTIVDISNKILCNLPSSKKTLNFDHDKWELNEKKFDIIISNFYLHLTNNLDALIKNINLSLNSNGFFIATFPGPNCCKELKKSMLWADNDLYGGVYRRFVKAFSIENITQVLNKNNFKIPIIEIDTFEMRYKKFSTLLNDVRYLGNSNVYLNRKKTFEKKLYFKKIEEIYWKKYSNNKEIILQFEIIFLSAWKNTKHYVK